jgi:hypothetical protein
VLAIALFVVALILAAAVWQAVDLYGPALGLRSCRARSRR